jgi:hypothetical protein
MKGPSGVDRTPAVPMGSASISYYRQFRAKREFAHCSAVASGGNLAEKRRNWPRVLDISDAHAYFLFTIE